MKNNNNIIMTTKINASLESIQNLLKGHNIAIGKCVNNSCKTPSHIHMGWSELCQGGGSHNGAMVNCPCGLDTCLIKKQNDLVCMNCIVKCDGTYGNGWDDGFVLCGQSALIECDKCKNKYCDPNILYFGSGCLICENQCTHCSND